MIKKNSQKTGNRRELSQFDEILKEKKTCNINDGEILNVSHLRSEKARMSVTYSIQHF